MNDALMQQAWQAHQAGDLATAARLYRDILSRSANNFDALYLLGYLHLQQSEWDSAERLMREAAKINPQSLDAWYNLSRALYLLRRYAAALHACDKALALRSDIPEFLLHRGNIFLELNRLREALANYDRALALKPEFPEAWNNRGNALAGLNRKEEALASYSRVLGARPGDIGALHHRALTFLELKRYEEAASDFARLLKIDPEFPYALGNLVYSKLNACDWSGLDGHRVAIADGLKKGARIITPVQNAPLSFSLEEQSRAARIWAADKYLPAQPIWRDEICRHDRIRIAYLSADFHAHATAALMAGVFESHDRTRFQTVAISYGPDDGSEMRKRLLPAFEHFLDAREKSDGEIAAAIKQMEIDIAVDLKGYTQDSRPGILAHRPAPIQAQYLGFPGTMGADYIDYVIADCEVIPPHHEPHYREKVARLPDTYQGNDSKRPIAAQELTRAWASLPQDGFVFCCFNNNFKIMPEIFALWMRLLNAIEGSVLWLLEDNAAAVRNLKREAEARGVDARRLIFAPRVNLDLHLARHRLAGLFLDTLPYNAHTTASDALWAGLPLITCAGTTFAGRVAASLLRAIGLPELIVDSFAAYESLAAELARNPAVLAALKAKLAANRLHCALFDTMRFTRNLESAYAIMWERHQRGLPPTSFSVPSSTQEGSALPPS